MKALKSNCELCVSASLREKPKPSEQSGLPVDGENAVHNSRIVIQ